MIIELTGPPGAGKSTIAKLVLKLLRENGIQALPAEEAGQAILRKRGQRAPLRVMKAWQSFWFSLENPSLVFKVVSAQWYRLIFWQHRFWALRWFFKTAGLYHFLRCHLASNKTAVFDEGLLHRSVTLFASDREAASAEALRYYVRLLPRPDLLIAVKVPPYICLERLRERKLPLRVQDLGAEAILDFVRNSTETINRAVGEALNYKWPLLIIDNTAPLAQVRQQLWLQWTRWEKTWGKGKQ